MGEGRQVEKIWRQAVKLNWPTQTIRWVYTGIKAAQAIILPFPHKPTDTIKKDKKDALCRHWAEHSNRDAPTMINKVTLGICRFAWVMWDTCTPHDIWHVIRRDRKPREGLMDIGKHQKGALKELTQCIEYDLESEVRVSLVMPKSNPPPRKDFGLHWRAAVVWILRSGSKC